MEKQKPKVATKFKDPDMCECIKRAIDGLVDDTWPLVINEVKYQLRMENNAPEVEIHKKTVHCCCIPFHCIRNWYNYIKYPNDKSIWKSIKTF